MGRKSFSRSIKARSPITKTRRKITKSGNNFIYVILTIFVACIVTMYACDSRSGGADKTAPETPALASEDVMQAETAPEDAKQVAAPEYVKQADAASEDVKQAEKDRAMQDCMKAAKTAENHLECVKKHAVDAEGHHVTLWATFVMESALAAINQKMDPDLFKYNHIRTEFKLDPDNPDAYLVAMIVDVVLDLKTSKATTHLLVGATYTFDGKQLDYEKVELEKVEP